MPTRVSSSTTYCTTGLRPTGSISFGCDLVAGSRRVPSPATGTTAISMSILVGKRAGGAGALSRLSRLSGVHPRFESLQHLDCRFVVVRQDLHQQHGAALGARIDPEMCVEDAAPAHAAGAPLAFRRRRHLDLKPESELVLAGSDWDISRSHGQRLSTNTAIATVILTRIFTSRRERCMLPPPDHIRHRSPGPRRPPCIELL